MCYSTSEVGIVSSSSRSKGNCSLTLHGGLFPKLGIYQSPGGLRTCLSILAVPKSALFHRSISFIWPGICPSQLVSISGMAQRAPITTGITVILIFQLDLQRLAFVNIFHLLVSWNGYVYHEASLLLMVYENDVRPVVGHLNVRLHLKVAEDFCLLAITFSGSAHHSLLCSRSYLAHIPLYTIGATEL